MLPTDEAHDLLELTRELADGELAPRVDDFEAARRVPARGAAHAGPVGPACSGLPYPEEYGGGGQPYEVYLQVLEILAGRWLAVAEAVTVHTLACYPVAALRHRDAQRKRCLPDMLGGELLGAYCLSEPAGRLGRRRADHPGGARRRRVRRQRHQGLDHPRRRGRLLQRLLPHRRARAPTASRACWPTPHTPGLHAAGAGADHGPALLAGGPGRLRRRPGAAPTGWSATRATGSGIAMGALDAGRLGIAACAVGLAQAALDYATALRPGARPVRPADHRLPGRRLHAGRHGHPDLRGAGADPARGPAARRRPPVLRSRRPRPSSSPPTWRCGSPPTRCRCSAGTATSADHPVERYMREAKVLQIVEGTNQIQRLVISRSLARPSA